MALAIDHVQPQRLLTVQEYGAMIEHGILRKDERLELIEGVVTEMSPIGYRHSAMVMHLTRLLINRLGDDAAVGVQNSFILSAFSQPQPDFAVSKPPLQTYDSRPPQTEDVLLVIEVSDTSLLHDRRTKIPLYARAGIPEVWIFDLVQSQVHMHSGPCMDGYKQVQSIARDGVITSAVLPNLKIELSTLPL